MSTVNPLMLLVGVMLCGLLVVMLWRGRFKTSMGIVTRHERPLVFWTTAGFSALIAICAFASGLGFKVRPSPNIHQATAAEHAGMQTRL